MKDSNKENKEMNVVKVKGRVGQISIKKGGMHHGISGKIESLHVPREYLKAFLKEEFTTSGGNLFQWLMTLLLKKFALTVVSHLGLTSFA